MRRKLKKSNAAEVREILQTKHIGAITTDSSVDLQRAWLMVNRAARIQGLAHYVLASLVGALQICFKAVDTTQSLE